VSLDARAGEVHALVGENGASKSTLKARADEVARQLGMGHRQDAERGTIAG
jgi:ABC-type sugar transport system ATPase subunit